MKNYSFAFTFAGIILYQLLFWQQWFGLNCLIFTLFALAGFLFLKPDRWKNAYTRATSLGTLACAITVCVHHSVWSEVVFCLSFATMIGFFHSSQIRLASSGCRLFVLNLLRAPMSFKSSHSVKLDKKWMPKARFISLFIIPLLLLILFVILYAFANEHFMELIFRGVFHLVNWFDKIFEFFFNKFNFLWFFFIGFGLLLVGSIFLSHWKPKWCDREGAKSYFLERIRRYPLIALRPMALKREFNIALITFTMLNGLLIIVNMLDIIYVWFGFDANEVGQLSIYVHEGTYMLIASIIIAMALVLYFFRRNLNFLQSNKKLKVLAFTWIVQNGILAISVLIRNLHYIEYRGLAYKRIGVMVFLLLTVFGLVTMYIKINQKRTTFFLIHINGWAIYTVLVLTTCINWDVAITRYNLFVDTKDGIDISFLMEDISDKNLFLLLENEQRLVEKGNLNHPDSWVVDSDYSSQSLTTEEYVHKKMEEKRLRFAVKMEQYPGWPSMNYIDSWNKKYIDQMQIR